MNQSYIKLEDLFIYKISIELCDMGWTIYIELDWQNKKIIGDQFITSVDSNAANIAEGYGRYHYLDKVKFFYNARASLFEAKHWINLMYKRKIINETKFNEFINRCRQVHYELNKFIKSQKIQKQL